MRGIKFRAWHPDADIMVEWDRLKNLRYAIDNGSRLNAVGDLEHEIINALKIKI